MNETQLTDAELARLEELAGKATPGKWSTTDYTGPDVLITAMLEGIPYSVWNRGTNARKEDLEYIAAACNMAPVLVAEVRKLREDYACEHQSLVFHEQMVARLMDRVETLEWLREVEALYGDTGWIFNQKQCAIDELHVTVLAAREALEAS